MKKVIKITERDLEQIVKKVIKEQSNMSATAGTQMRYFEPNDVLKGGKENINPKNLKFGSGGKNNPNQVNDVIQLQQKLINLGLLKTKTGKPTGYFGKLTNDALTRYNQQKQTTQQNSNKPESGEKSFLDKTKEFCLSPFKRLRDFANSFNLSAINPLPPHMRAFLSYLSGRVEPINVNFFKPDEIKLISDKVNSFFPKNQKCRRDKKCYVSFYNDTDWGKVKSGDEKVLLPDLAKSIGFTIGNGLVIDNGNSYIIKDIYDFNNFKNNPQAYSPENAGSTISNALKKISCGNYIQGIEELASFKQAKGYKGIPVEIQIPKSV